MYVKILWYFPSLIQVNGSFSLFSSLGRGLMTWEARISCWLGIIKPSELIRQLVLNSLSIGKGWGESSCQMVLVSKRC